MLTIETKEPTNSGGQLEANTSQTIDKKIKSAGGAKKRGLETLTRIFLALPDLMNSIDINFLTRFGIDNLNADDMEALGRVQYEADCIERELIGLAVIRHKAAGKDEKTARRLASAEFAAIFASGVDFLTGRGGDHA